jgi:hypothetical protein
VRVGGLASLGLFVANATQVRCIEAEYLSQGFGDIWISIVVLWFYQIQYLMAEKPTELACKSMQNNALIAPRFGPSIATGTSSGCP